MVKIIEINHYSNNWIISIRYFINFKAILKNFRNVFNFWIFNLLTIKEFFIIMSKFSVENLLQINLKIRKDRKKCNSKKKSPEKSLSKWEISLI